jgi:pilus assembly protein Flp/PilA
MKNTIQQFLREEDGVAAIEYGLLAGLIAVGIIVAARTIGTNLNTVFGYVSGALAGVVAPAAA